MKYENEVIKSKLIRKINIFRLFTEKYILFIYFICINSLHNIQQSYCSFDAFSRHRTLLSEPIEQTFEIRAYATFHI